MPGSTITITTQIFKPSLASSNAWPQDVTRGSVTLLRNRAAGTFTATLVARDTTSSLPIALYEGQLADLPLFLVFVRLVDPPGHDPTIPGLDITVQASDPQPDEQPRPPGGAIG